MKKVICVLSITFTILAGAFAQEPISENQVSTSDLQTKTHYEAKEVSNKTDAPTKTVRPKRVKSSNPVFVGGMEALIDYLDETCLYPEAAREAGVEGTVKVKFRVNAEGKIENAQVIESLGHGCDEEALRLIENMPEWVPGHQGPVKVKASVILGINFRLR